MTMENIWKILLKWLYFIVSWWFIFIISWSIGIKILEATTYEEVSLFMKICLSILCILLIVVVWSLSISHENNAKTNINTANKEPEKKDTEWESFKDMSPLLKIVIIILITWLGSFLSFFISMIFFGLFFVITWPIATIAIFIWACFYIFSDK